VLAALLPSVGRGGVRACLAYGLLALAVGASFLALLLGPAAAQRSGALLDCWRSGFPDWGRPWSVPGWMALNTFEAARYCCKPLGQALLPLAVVGGILLARRGQGAAVTLLTLPVGLALLASCLGRYPYGGTRLLVFAAPALALLTAAAVPPALAWLRRRRRVAAAGLVAVLLLPAAVSAWRLVSPWQVADAPSAARHVVARLGPRDAVAGNDWAHLYYFRPLGDAFRYQGDGAAEGAERVWVVFAAELDATARLRAAAGLAPAGWRLAEHADFTFTTVALFVPPP
jgi:hypothetical protein